MLFTIASHAIFISLSSSALATSLTISKHPTNISSLTLFNNSLVHEASSISNRSDTLTANTLLPYSFSVPNTQTYLRLGFGLRRHRLDLMSMGGLIAVLQQMITDDIVNEGEYAYPGLVDVYRQELAYRLGDGFYFFVHTPKGSQRVFTWRQLRNVVEGLRLFLIVGERNYCTKFQSWDGPWRWIHVGQELGEGGIVLDRNGAEKVADRKELSESVME